MRGLLHFKGFWLNQDHKKGAIQDGPFSKISLRRMLF